MACREQEGPEMTELRHTLTRDRSALAKDFVGASALVAIFVVTLSLPGFF